MQIVFAENAADFPLRAGLVVPKIGFKAVRCEHHRPAAKFSLQTVGIQDCLFTSNIRVLAGALGLHHRQGQAVFSKENIVHISRLAHYTGHALHGVLRLYVRFRAGKLPARQLYIDVDIMFAGFKLRGGVRRECALLLVLLSRRCKLGGHGLDFLAQRLNLRVFFA